MAIVQRILSVATALLTVGSVSPRVLHAEDGSRHASRQTRRPCSSLSGSATRAVLMGQNTRSREQPCVLPARRSRYSSFQTTR
jgi:hypothetical protein